MLGTWTGVKVEGVVRSDWIGNISKVEQTDC